MTEHEIDAIELTKAPELVEEDDRKIVTAEAQSMMAQHPMTATILPLGPGLYLPFTLGDRLVSAAVQGRKLMGVHPLCWAGDVVPPQSMGNIELRGTRGGNVVIAPDRDDPDSEVRLGRDTREGATYQRLMMFDHAHIELQALRAALRDLVLPKLGALLTAISDYEGAGDCVATALELASYYDGDPSIGVKAAK